MRFLGHDTMATNLRPHRLDEVFNSGTFYRAEDCVMPHSKEPAMRLPNNWHRRVRSAIVHAASMATIAFTHALARVANNPDAQLRAQAEIDRL